MVTDPDLAVEIRVGAVVGQVGKFVQHSVRQKCTDRGEAQGQTAMPFPIEDFLNENASEDVGGGLHSFGRQARLSISKRVLRTFHSAWSIRWHLTLGNSLTFMNLAEGVGFEPTVRLPVRLISSQVPLTTQPPFRRLDSKH